MNNIIKFVQYQKDRVERKEITGATVRNYVKSIKLFCEMADTPISWKKITRGLPKGRRYADDRVPTMEEIRKVVEYPDRRIKAIVYSMASSGIPIGAWDYLQWGHFQPVEKDKETVAAKMVVYAGEEYFTFISGEAWRALTDWIEYREDAGELINNDSWVMRDLWDTRVAQGRGLVTRPKKTDLSWRKKIDGKSYLGTGVEEEIRGWKKETPLSG